MNKHYTISYFNQEARTKDGESWTTEDFLNDFNNNTSYEATEVESFDTLAEAEAKFDKYEPLAPYVASGTIGKILSYEVVELNEVTVDEDGEETGWQLLDVKTSPALDVEEA